MGRRSQHKPEELRHLILDAAQAIVEQGGVAELSAREIGRAIGYAPGTLYNMYQNLDEILLRVEVRVLEQLDQQLATEMDGAAGAEAIRGFATAYVAFAHKRPSLWRLLSEHNLPTGIAAPSWYHAAAEAPMLRLQQPLTAMMRNSDPAAIPRAAQALWSAIHGMTVISTNSKLGPADVDVAMQQVIDLVDHYLSGIGNRAGKTRDVVRGYKERPAIART